VGHFAASIDEDPDLATDLEADLREFASEFVADDLLGRHAASIESLQPAYLVGFEAVGIAVDADGVTSLNAGAMAILCTAVANL
jgi:hypothetical protein